MVRGTIGKGRSQYARHFSRVFSSVLFIQGVFTIEGVSTLARGFVHSTVNSRPTL